jgi:NitT/TauT family transport system substrate-binding protein
MNGPKLRIVASRHSAFYTPLIATLAGGFLAEEDCAATYGTLPRGRSGRDLLRGGEADVVQAAVSSSWGPMEAGETDLPVHFAQINIRDGFFLSGRLPETSFEWKSLEGKMLLADHGGQPLHMLRYAAHCQGVDWNRIDVIDAGTIDEIDAAFRGSRGDYVHQQGPAPQQLERDGIGHIVAAVGAAMPPVAFSSLMAMPRFLETDLARAFTRAYRKARTWAQEAPAEEVAAREATYFPGVAPEALSATIRRYQALGCWLGDLRIPAELYEQALEVFLHSGAVAGRHPYDQVVVAPPE